MFFSKTAVIELGFGRQTLDCFLHFMFLPGYHLDLHRIGADTQ